MEGLKQNDIITCWHCEKHILTAIRDIPFASPIKSADFVGIEWAQWLKCPHCDALYSTINSRTKQTEIIFEKGFPECLEFINENILKGLGVPKEFLKDWDK